MICFACFNLSFLFIFILSRINLSSRRFLICWILLIRSTIAIIFSLLYLTGISLFLSNSYVRSFASSLLLILRNDFVHLVFLGFFLCLKFLKHLDVQNWNFFASFLT